MALVHASPSSAWSSPSAGASDEELESTYGPLGQAMVAYGHIHQPFVRDLATITVINHGSVGQPLDGDPRASYLLIDDGMPQIRRVEYDIEREVCLLAESGLPHGEWMARTLRAARPQPVDSGTRS